MVGGENGKELERGRGIQDICIRAEMKQEKGVGKWGQEKDWITGKRKQE